MGNGFLCIILLDARGMLLKPPNQNLPERCKLDAVLTTAILLLTTPTNAHRLFRILQVYYSVYSPYIFIKFMATPARAQHVTSSPSPLLLSDLTAPLATSLHFLSLP